MRSQGVCLVCSFYHELMHWLIEQRRPVRCVAEMLIYLGVCNTPHRLLRRAHICIMDGALCAVHAACVAKLSKP